MAWKTTTPMNGRIDLIGDYHSGGYSVAELARRHTISRKTVYKWIGRYEEESVAGLEARSRAPHTQAGAVSAAIEWKFRGAAQKSRVETVLEHIVPALDALDATQPPETLLKSGVDANVRHAVREILATPEAQASLATGHMKLVGAVYHLDSGAVDFFD
jgi:transposase-like protein